MRNSSLFSSVSATIAGLHTMHHIEINKDFIGSDVVNEHEALHDKFLCYSEFGVVQSTLAKLLQEDLAAEDFQFYEDLFAELCKNSNNTHEYGATYISVKGLPKYKRTAALAALPYSYRRYYHFMAHRIDLLSPIVYVQKIIAEWVIIYALTNGISLATIQAISERKLAPVKHMIPDIQIRQLLEILEYHQNELPSLIETAISIVDSDLIRKGFDIRVEHHWGNVESSRLNEIEERLHDKIGPWIAALASTLWQILPHGDWKKNIYTLEKLILERTGYFNLSAGIVSYGIYPFYERLQWEDKEELKETYIKAVRLGQLTITNVKCNIEKYVFVINEQNFSTILQACSKYDWSFIAKNIYNNTEDIKDFFWLIHESVSTAFFFEINYTYVLRILRQRLVLAGTGLPFSNQIRTMTVGLNAYCGLSKIIEKIHGIFALRTNDGGFAIAQTFHWYLCGDFLWWYDVLTNNPSDLKLTYAFDPTIQERISLLNEKLVLQDLNIDDLRKGIRGEKSIYTGTLGDFENSTFDLTDSVKNGLTFIFKCDIFKGYLFRTLPNSITLPINSIICSDSRYEELTTITQQEKVDAINSIFNFSLPLIELCWKSY